MARKERKPYATSRDKVGNLKRGGKEICKLS